MEKSSKLSSIIFWIIIIIVLVVFYKVYQKYYFNDFVKAEYYPKVSTFTRDKEERYEEKTSYKIESPEYNDAIFYKKVKVEHNTPYKVTCMVKTQDIKNEKENSGAGAAICLVNSTETSKSIKGTNDWQEIEMIFNSQNKEEVEIGFRLGGIEDNSKGTAWFCNFNLEKGTKSTDNEWNFACFVLENVNVTIDGKQQKIAMSLSDIEAMKTNMSRFKNACSELSNNQMTANYDFYEIRDEIKSITYSEEFGYYISPYDAEDLISEYLKNKDYDHIFVCVRLGDLDKNMSIQVNDWIGLGGMDLHQIGFSNIRLPNNKNSYIYTYNPSINIFPEEVFIHEFLHSLERTLIEYDYDIPALHDYKIYGYEEKNLIGLKEWYKDYMTCNISNSEGNKVGLDKIVYKLQPAQEDDFLYSTELEFIDESNNLISEIKSIFSNIFSIFSNIGKNYERNTTNESIGV